MNKSHSAHIVPSSCLVSPHLRPESDGPDGISTLCSEAVRLLERTGKKDYSS
jgi:hypothetical protein